jgi:hypothetical protein
MEAVEDKFADYLVSIECKNVFYQGIVAKIDSKNAIIRLKNCFQNGLSCGNKLIEIKYLNNLASLLFVSISIA